MGINVNAVRKMREGSKSNKAFPSFANLFIFNLL